MSTRSVLKVKRLVAAARYLFKSSLLKGNSLFVDGEFNPYMDQWVTLTSKERPSFAQKTGASDRT